MHLFVQEFVETLGAEDNSTSLLHLLFIIYPPVFRVVNLSLQTILRVLPFYFESQNEALVS